jgi:hypothetical protein
VNLGMLLRPQGLKGGLKFLDEEACCLQFLVGFICVLTKRKREVDCGLIVSEKLF